MLFLPQITASGFSCNIFFQPSWLYKIVKTPLFETLLKCMKVKIRKLLIDIDASSCILMYSQLFDEFRNPFLSRILTR